MRTHYLTVTGMTSAACRRTVADALAALRGVGMVRVSPTHNAMSVDFNERFCLIETCWLPGPPKRGSNR